MAKRTFERAPALVAKIQALLDSMKDEQGKMPAYTGAIATPTLSKMDAFEENLSYALAKLQTLAAQHHAGAIEVHE